jgi:hypothetical protein
MEPRTRIDRLEDDDRQQFQPVIDKWITGGLDCTPVDHATVENGIRRCYEAAGIPWHGNVVWVESPLAVAVASPIAAHLRGAVLGAVGRRGGRRAVYGAVDGVVLDAVAGAVRDAVDGVVAGAVAGAVLDAVDGAVAGAVDGAVAGAVYGAVGGAVGDAVAGAVDDAVGDAVAGAVDGAVAGAVGGAVLSNWYRYLGGQHWAAWNAWRDYFRVIGLQLDKWALFDAWNAANLAGWWWPHRQFVIIAERPTELHREQVAPPGWGSHRLHSPDGPAIRWGNEWALWFWHGTRVPSWVVEAPTVDLIKSESNTEIRRCAIESYGWGRYLDDLNVTPVDVAADPGNPGQTLRLYDLPDDAQPFDQPVRLLVMANGSLDVDGTRRTFAETVPADMPDAVAAAAWQFDVHPDTYRQLCRRT